MVVAIIIGCVNAFIVVRLGVNSFIATLGMSSILAATQVIVSHNAQPLPPTGAAWNNFTQTTVRGFQIVVLYMLIIAFVLWWLTAHADRPLPVRRRRQPRGRPPVGRSDPGTTVALVTSATVAGGAGDHVLLAQRAVAELRRDPPAPGVRRRLPRLDAADPGTLQRLGTLLAIFVLATGVQGLQLVSGASWLNDMFNGVALIIAVALSIQRSPSAHWQRIKARFGRGSTDLRRPGRLRRRSAAGERVRRCDLGLTSRRDPPLSPSRHSTSSSSQPLRRDQ
jgi:ribose transport system permease protein